MTTADDVHEKVERIYQRLERLSDRVAGVESELEELQHALSEHLFRARKK